MDDVSEAEIMAACGAGLVLDCSDGGARRVIDAALLQRCCDELGEQVHRRGIRLRHGAVAGWVKSAGIGSP